LQYLLQRGIAVVAPNIRGSSGYGKTYKALDDQMLRHDSIKDIGALLDCIRCGDLGGPRQSKKSDSDSQRIHALDPQRICLMGRSYGGFMVLACMAEYASSHALRCCVSTCGISSIVTFLESTAASRRDLRRPEYGDERVPSMRAFLQRISPLHHPGLLKAKNCPLLLCQGANDARVPLAEALQVAEKVDAGSSSSKADGSGGGDSGSSATSSSSGSGAGCWVLVADGEGHVFRRRRTLEFNSQTIALFLEAHL
jgi:dipeptidyl aminopeptidase/acylaminoacyl peptidase